MRGPSGCADAVLKYDLSLPTADNYEVVEVMRRKLAHVAGVRVCPAGSPPPPPFLPTPPGMFFLLLLISSMHLLPYSPTRLHASLAKRLRLMC